MAEETNGASTTSAETAKTPADAPAPGTSPAAEGEQKTFSQADLDRIIATRLEQERTQATQRLERERQDAQARAAAEAGDHKTVAEQAQARVKELEAAIAARDHAELQRTVAAKAGLPADLAARLQGTTEAELEADAKALAKLIPAAPPPAGGATNPARPGAHRGGDDEKLEVWWQERTGGRTSTDGVRL